MNESAQALNTLSMNSCIMSSVHIVYYCKALHDERDLDLIMFCHVLNVILANILLHEWSV